eukprot:gene713-biopygen7954
MGIDRIDSGVGGGRAGMATGMQLALTGIQLALIGAPRRYNWCPLALSAIQLARLALLRFAPQDRASSAFLGPGLSFLLLLPQPPWSFGDLRSKSCDGEGFWNADRCIRTRRAHARRVGEGSSPLAQTEGPGRLGHVEHKIGIRTLQREGWRTVVQLALARVQLMLTGTQLALTGIRNWSAHGDVTGSFVVGVVLVADSQQ